MRYAYHIITKYLYIILFLIYEYEAINHSKRKYFLNIKGNSYNLYFYYITMFLGTEERIQNFILDTTSSITTSPCNLCSCCGEHLNDYYIINSNSSIININSEECKSLPNVYKAKDFEKNNNFDLNSCFFLSKIENEEILGLYSYNNIFFESIFQKNDEENINSYILTKSEIQLPIGCTLKETGFFKSSLADGIIGLNNNDKSFISLMYKKDLISNNLFSLCLDKEGGYFSIGDIEAKYHICPEIKFVDYNQFSEFYELEIQKIIIKDIEIDTQYSSIINSFSTISYFPEEIFNNITIALFSICSEYGGQCGKLKRIEGYGICSDFSNINNYNIALKNIFPSIKIKFKNYDFIWKPKNYLVNFTFKITKKKVRTCFGIDTEKNLDKIILGTNFMHGYDIIFDRNNFKIGFCEASCSRNLSEKNDNKLKNIKIEEKKDTIKNEITNKITITKNENRYEEKKILKHPSEVKNELFDTQKNINNENGRYFRYLVYSLLIIFIFFFTFILCNNFYYQTFITNRQMQFIQNKSSNFKLNLKNNINKESLITQKIELVETLDKNK